MLSFRIASDKTVHIAADDEGVAMPMRSFEKIRLTGGHVHLRAPSCGGVELSDQTPWGEDDAVPEVMITWAGE